MVAVLKKGSEEPKVLPCRESRTRSRRTKEEDQGGACPSHRPRLCSALHRGGWWCRRTGWPACSSAHVSRTDHAAGQLHWVRGAPQEGRAVS